MVFSIYTKLQHDKIHKLTWNWNKNEVYQFRTTFTFAMPIQKKTSLLMKIPIHTYASLIQDFLKKGVDSKADVYSYSLIAMIGIKTCSWREYTLYCFFQYNLSFISKFYIQNFAIENLIVFFSILSKLFLILYQN